MAFALPLPLRLELDLVAGVAARLDEEELEADRPAPARDGVA